MRFINEQLLGGTTRFFRIDVIAEPIGNRLKNRKGFHIGLLLRGVGPPGSKWHSHIVTTLLGSSFHGGAPTEHDEIRQRNGFPKVSLNFLQSAENFRELVR